MAQFGIHMCWYCCYVWSIHRSYMEFLDLAWSKLVFAFTSFNTKFTFSDMPDLLAPELQPPLPYHYFSESDSSNPEKGDDKIFEWMLFWNRVWQSPTWRSPGLQRSSIQENTQPESSAKLFIDTCWLNDWNRESMNTWNTCNCAVKIYLYMTLNKQRKPPETLSHLRPSFQESEVLSCGPSLVAHNWRAWFAKRQPAIKAWLVGSFR